MGLHLRAEYHILRDRWLGLRIEGGGRWTPTQNFSFAPVDQYGSWQYMDVNLGVAATITPVPRGRIAPYLVFGVSATQSWTNIQYYGTQSRTRSGSYGSLDTFWGLGTRVRLGERLIQMELRLSHRYDLTIGTGFRF
jgi:hypothetical protein